MTVSDLIAKLQEMPGDLRVAVSLRDPGGWDHRCNATSAAVVVERSEDRFGPFVIIADQVDGPSALVAEIH